MQEYKSLRELYEALVPALNVKIRMFKNTFSYIRKEDIWNYLKDNIWINSVNLSISQMVSDIINVDGIKIENYLKENRFRNVGE